MAFRFLYSPVSNILAINYISLNPYGFNDKNMQQKVNNYTE
jgi:hypothetical protein